MRHDVGGLLSMANSGPHTNGSQFFLTFIACPWLDGKHVVFGKITEGMDLLQLVEKYGTNSGRTRAEIKVEDCGEIKESK